MNIDGLSEKQSVLREEQSELRNLIVQQSSTIESLKSALSSVIEFGADKTVDAVCRLENERKVNNERHDVVTVTLNALDREVRESKSKSIAALRRIEEVSLVLEKLSSKSSLAAKETNTAHERLTKAESAMDCLQQSCSQEKAELNSRFCELESYIRRKLEDLSLKQQSVTPTSQTLQAHPKFPSSLSCFVSAAQRAVVDSKKELAEHRIKDKVLVLWYSESLRSTRRVVTIRRVRDVFASKLRSYFTKLKCYTRSAILREELTTFKENLNEEFRSFVKNDVYYAHVKAFNSGHTDLSESIDQLRIASCTRADQLSDQLAKTLSSLKDCKDSLDASDEFHASEINKLKEAFENTENKFRQLHIDKINVSQEPQPKQKDQVESSHGILSDVLLMWNSIKQLDNAKVDRKDMERVMAHLNDPNSRLADEYAQKFRILEDKCKIIEANLDTLRLSSAERREVEKQSACIHEQTQLPIEAKLISRAVSTRPSTPSRSKKSEQLDDFIDNTRHLLENVSSSRSSLRERDPETRTLSTDRKLSKINPSGGWGLNRSIIIKKWSCFAEYLSIVCTELKIGKPHISREMRNIYFRKFENSHPGVYI